MTVTEQEVVPVKAQGSLIAFASVVLDDPTELRCLTRSC
jgi:hypothetical protein